MKYIKKFEWNFETKTVYSKDYFVVEVGAYDKYHIKNIKKLNDFPGEVYIFCIENFDNKDKSKKIFARKIISKDIPNKFKDTNLYDEPTILWLIEKDFQDLSGLVYKTLLRTKDFDEAAEQYKILKDAQKYNL